ncbi:MAG: hypothetical protein HWN66_20710 [Candidatus Helarchaeota archaeon]|nr:hypothetical protein [Candidatus Helarchaeota archaeon]
MIPVLNIDLYDKVIKLGDYYIKKFDEKTLEEWGITNRIREVIYKKFLDKSCLVIKEEGNNRSLVCDRAREKAYFLIKVLKVSLAKSRLLHDWQFLYHQDAWAASKLVDKNDTVKFSWKRPHVPINLEFGDKLEEDLLEFLDKIKIIITENKIHPSIKKSFNNALTWVGRALEEKDLDIRIIYLSTALESILTTISDIKKGEALAYRMLLLNTFLDAPFIHPARILYIYELRSKIIHGSELYVATKSDYYTMRSIAIDTIEYALSIIENESINRKSEFITLLELQEEKRIQILEWLRLQGDKRSISIANYMEENIK